MTPTIRDGLARILERVHDDLNRLWVKCAEALSMKDRVEPCCGCRSSDLFRQTTHERRGSGIGRGQRARRNDRRHLGVGHPAARLSCFTDLPERAHEFGCCGGIAYLEVGKPQTGSDLTL